MLGEPIEAGRWGEKEVELFDRVVLLQREGKTPDLDAILAELPDPERRAALRQLIATTNALKALGRVLKSHVAAAITEEPLKPFVVQDSDIK